MDSTHMRRFWDARARENAMFFVDDRLDYGDPDATAFWRGGERDVDALLGAVDVALQPADRVLEIGCGVGRLTRVLAARAAEVTALDVSGEMLTRAAQLNPGLDNVRWLLGDGTTLAGVDSRSVDTCVSHVVFQHIPDPRITLGYIAEIGRVLRPGGWAAFQLSTDPGVHRARADREWRFWRRRPRGQNDPAWLGSAVALEQISEAAANSGLLLERLEYPGTQFSCALVRAA